MYKYATLSTCSDTSLLRFKPVLVANATAISESLASFCHPVEVPERVVGAARSDLLVKFTMG